MKFLKYVVTEDPAGRKSLLIGYVEYHKDLIPESHKCLGGGLVAVYRSRNEILFYGTSHDYGRCWADDFTEAFASSSDLIKEVISFDAGEFFKGMSNITFKYAPDDYEIINLGNIGI